MAAPDDLHKATDIASDVITKVRDAVSSVVSRTHGVRVGFSNSDSLLRLGIVDSLSYVKLLLELEKVFGRAVPREIVSRPNEYDSVEKIAERYRSNAPAASTAERDAVRFAEERRRQLSPQFDDSDKVPMVPAAYVMERPQSEYRSVAANTDDLGFRVAKIGGELLSRDAFFKRPEKKGIILGSSYAWGIGPTSDDNVLHNVLNSIVDDTVWYSFALRAANLTQERLAVELYAPLDAKYVVWISGPLFMFYGLMGHDHRFHIPWPKEAAQSFKLRNKVDPPCEPTMEFSRLWPAMEVLLDREFEIMARLFKPSAKTIIFGYQAFLETMEKELSPEEDEILGLYRNIPKPLTTNITTAVLKQHTVILTKKLQELCNSYGFKFIDFNVSPEFLTKEWLFVDPGHLRDRGHELMAMSIHKLLDD